MVLICCCEKFWFCFYRFLFCFITEYIIRSHEVKPQGYEIAHDGKCVTVFSAPNYWSVVWMTSENTKPQMRFFHALNPLTPIDDQYRISPYNINTILGRNVTRIWWKYKVGDYSLIQNQILRINIIRVTWQTVRRITNEILGMRGLPPPPLNTCGCQVCLQCSSQESIKSQLLVVYRRLEGLLLPSIKPAQALMFGFHLNPLVISNSPYCLSYNSYDVNLENLV